MPFHGKCRTERDRFWIGRLLVVHPLDQIGFIPNIP